MFASTCQEESMSPHRRSLMRVMLLAAVTIFALCMAAGTNNASAAPWRANPQTRREITLADKGITGPFTRTSARPVSLDIDVRNLPQIKPAQNAERPNLVSHRTGFNPG